MNNINGFELHYYFSDKSHEIDAFVRNRCEAELLGIIIEASHILEIEVSLIKDVYNEGGFRDIWKALGDNQGSIAILLTIIQIIISVAPHLNFESKELELEEKRLAIEEKRLNIEKLKQEIENGKINSKAVNEAALAVSSNLKIIKRKSNFYSRIEEYQKVTKIGITILDEKRNPVADEVVVLRSDFYKHILGTNRLRSEEDDKAIIEIISPVLKEGRYKWKGVYKDAPISFEMNDHSFRDAVLIDNIPFRHGSKIVCALVAHRELDEAGNIKVTGYSVTTVLEKIDGDTVTETIQGKKYRHAKKLSKSQSDLFGSW
ncbi:hypothetical protein [Methylomonas methanica]|nr:hypothetical protein [Methylomonas methanica]